MIKPPFTKAVPGAQLCVLANEIISTMGAIEKNKRNRSRRVAAIKLRALAYKRALTYWYNDGTQAYRSILRSPVGGRIGGVLLVHAGDEAGTDSSRRLLEVLTHAPEQVTRPPSPGLVISAIHVPVNVVFRVELQKKKGKKDALFSSSAFGTKYLKKKLCRVALPARWLTTPLSPQRVESIERHELRC